MALKEKQNTASSRSSKEKYQKLTDREQILHRPDMYMGSIRTSDSQQYIYDEQQNLMVSQDLKFNSGLLKIFDEVITNAQDQAIRTHKDRKKTKNIYVQINKQTGIISVCNDGPSIEIKKHSEYNIYIPELIFGNLRTSENYDDSQTDRRVGGLNGLGVKLTNIYSKHLEIDIICKGKRYQQKFQKNMSDTIEPKITSLEKKEPEYVKVSFLPDYQRFGLSSLTDDMNKIMKKRVYDCAGSCAKLITTHLNDKQINIKSFKDYCSLYLSEDTYQLQIEQPKEIPDIKIKNKNYSQSQELRDDTQIVVAQSDGNFKQISFINNVNTIKGGKHVDYIVDQLQKEIISTLKKKRGNKDLKFSSSFVKENICIFLNMHVYQPTFSSQAKDEFSSDTTTWGYVPIIEDKYIKKIVDSPIGQAIMDRVSSANDKPIAKNEGKKKKTLGFIDGLVDATKAGTSESNKCVLFLVEGKSAAQLVISGRSQILNGIDHYGVFALRGKVLNVKDASQKKILANNEITQIKQILGLQQGKVYKDLSELRYGKILIAADSDVDGFHIGMLIGNLFQTIWHSLIEFKTDTFINRFLTPIIIATKRTGNQQLDFYTQQDFNQWREQNESQVSRWKIKYFKGLAVFDQNSGKRHFKNMRIMKYRWQSEDDQYFTLAFDKKNATQRKSWLQNYDKNAILDYNESETTYTELINKELIHFSIDDVARSICSLMDGLKPSQRKILYACFKRKLWSDELRVAQLAGYCSEVSSYSHGEASLQGAIVQMAQDFVGTNNINLLLPNGQFGTRYDPKASGAPRYIHTQLNSIVKILMNQDDNSILNYLKDDENMSIEPEYYLPIIPMALVNGCTGIGTGFSTKIPNYNPLDIIHNLQVLLLQYKNPHKSINNFIDLVPYYKGFSGKIITQNIQKTTHDSDYDSDYHSDNDEYTDTGEFNSQHSDSPSNIFDYNKKYFSMGVFKRIASSKIQVTEIPIGKTVKHFVEHVKTKYAQPQSEVIEDIRDNNFTLTIDFQDPAIVDNLLLNESNNGPLRIYKDLQLVNQIHISNMYMFNHLGQITKYHSPMDVISAFFQPRLNFYQKRKDFLLQQLHKDIFVLKQQTQFIKDIIHGSLDLRNKKLSTIKQELLSKNYLPLDSNNLPLKSTDPAQQSLHNSSRWSFDFLTEMPISSYTLEKKDSLLNSLKSKESIFKQIQDTLIVDMWYEELQKLKSELLNSGFSI